MFVRNIIARHFFEAFFISAISSILTIRLYLYLTGFPQVGREGLHIAHMLWGGALMLAAIIMLLGFLDKRSKQIAAILGGVGFGTFLDELGKFITSDNNYFYQPTVALIYIIFVILFLSLRLLEKDQKLSQHEILVNALELTKSFLTTNSDRDQKKALDLLAKFQENEISKTLKIALVSTRVDTNPSLLRKLDRVGHNLYASVFGKKYFTGTLVLFFAAYSLYGLFKASQVLSLYFKLQEFSLTFIDWGQFTSLIASSIMVAIGILVFRRSRLNALKWFKYAVLVSIFLTQFFSFYKEQFYSLTTLAFNLTILLAIQYLISRVNIEPIQN